MTNVISKSALLILAAAILYLLISGNLLSPSLLVIVGQLVAIALSIWARRSFQAGQFNIHAEPREGSMLSSGPYQYIRHPMYAAALLLIWISVIGHLSAATVIVGIVVTAAIAVRITTEDQLLRASFPAYAAYADATKRVIPFVI